MTVLLFNPRALLSPLYRTGRGGLARARAAAQMLGVLVCLGAAGEALAQTVYWDGGSVNQTPDGSVSGGLGSWTNSLINWTTFDGLTEGIWLGLGNVPVFGVTGATVSVTGIQDIGGLTFNTTGYTLSGGTLNGSVLANNPLAISTGTATIGSVLSGANPYSKEGAGSLVLSGVNTFSGPLTVNAGTLRLANTNSAGTAAGSTTVNSSATLEIDAAVSYAEPLVLAGGTLSYFNTGTGVYSGAISLTGDSLITTLNTTALAYPSISGAVNLNANTLSMTCAQAQLDMRGVISGAGGITQNGGSTCSLVQNNTYSGVTLVQTGGTLNIQRGQALGTVAGNTVVQVGAALTMSASAGTVAEPLTLSGSLKQLGSAPWTWSGPITLGAAATIQGGYLTVSGGIDTAGFTPILDNAGGNLSISSVILGGGGISSLGAGTTTFSGANTYTGTTTVTAGTLLINGNQSSAIGATTVASGAKLGGSGTLGGAVTISSGGTLTPGAATVPATLAMTSLTLSPGAILTMDLAQAATVGGASNDFVQIGGAVTLGGTLNITSVLTTVPSGIYRLMNYTGAVPTASALAIGTFPSGNTAGQFVVDTSTSGQVNLIVLAPPTVIKSFNPTSITAGGTSTLTITLTNPNTVALTGVAFTDTYPTSPAGLVNSTAPSGGTCTGTQTGTAGGTNVGLTGGSIAASGSCTVIVSVTSATANSYVNTIPTNTVASSGGGNTTAATATLTVALPTVYWDGPASDTSTIEGGSGTWTTGMNWTTNAGTSNGVWPGGTSIAIFQSVAGTANLSGTTQSIGGLAFNTDAYTLSGGTLSGSAVANNPLTVSTGTSTVGSVLSGANPYSKEGAGGLVLSAVNTFTGAMTINAGSLVITDPDALGSTGAASGTVVNSGGALAISGGITTAAETLMLNGGTLAGVGGLNPIFTGPITQTGPSFISASFPTPQQFTINSVININGHLLTVRGGDNALRLFGAISGSGGITTTSGAPVTLAGNSTFTGLFTSTGATVSVQHSNALGAGGSAANGTVMGAGGTLSLAACINVPNEYLTLNGATFASQGGNPNRFSGPITLGAATAFAANGPLFVSGTVNNAGFALTLNGASTNSVEGVVSGSGGLVKQGTGTGLLRAANTYTGTTAVTSGTLYVGADQSAATGAISVASGATLAGSSTLGGIVTVNSGGRFAPNVMLASYACGAGDNLSQTSGVALLTTAGLNLGAGSHLDMKLGRANTAGGTLNDLVQVNGNLTLGGGTLNVAVPTTPAGGSFTPGTYRLINYTGTLTNSGGLVIGNLPPGFTAAQMVIDTSTVGQVNLIVLSANATYWDVSPQNNGVVNGGTGTWMAADSGSNLNWTDSLGVSNTQWTAGGTAIFAGTAGIVTVSGAPSISGLTFTTDGYRLTGGTLNGVVATNVITVAGGTAASISSALTGMAFDKQGAGTLTLLSAGSGSYTGTMTVSAGSLAVQNNTGLGTSASGTIVLSGATLELNNGVTIVGESLTLAGTGVSGRGAFRPSTAVPGGNHWSGPVTLAADAVIVNASGIFNLSGTVDNAGHALTVNGAASAVATFSGVVSGSGSLVKSGAGTLALAVANTYGGTTAVSGGILQFGIDSALPSTTVATVASGATLNLNSTTQSIASLNNSGTLALGTGGSLTLTSGASSIGAITGSGTIIVNPGATLTLGADLSNSGVNIVLAGGTLNLGVHTHSMGALSLTAPSALDFASAGTAQLTAATLTPAFALNVTNWTQGTDHFYAAAVTGAPARNASNVSPLNNIALTGHTAPQTAWLSSNEINTRLAPTVAKVFSPTSIATGASSTLTITLSNPNSNALTAAAFTDTYPAGLVNAGVPGGATTCSGGVVTASAASGSVTLRGGTIPANSSCTVTVMVTSYTAGNYINTLTAGVLSSSGGGNAEPASAALSVSGGAVTGHVFLDNGAGGGTANDGVSNGSEAPQSGITVSLGNCAGTTYASTITDSTGNYILTVPSSVAMGAPLCVVQTNQSGRSSTGASIGSTELPSGTAVAVSDTTYTYTRAPSATTPDTIAFAFNGTSHSDLNFADVDNSTFGATSAKSSQPGNSVSYPHTFTARTAGSVTFRVTSSVSSPAVSGWTEKIMADPSCTGSLQAGAAVLYPPTVATGVVAGQQVCVIVQQMIPSNAPIGSTNDTRIQATLVLSDASPALSASYTVDDVTTVSSSALELKKEVRNVTQNAVFGINNQAKSGEVLEYRLTYTNNGASSISTLSVADVTPAYTRFVSATEGPTPVGLTCQKNTPINPAPANPAVACAAMQATGGTGPLGWQFTGTLNPSGTGAVLFQVRVD